jgi:hypothetical protein
MNLMATENLFLPKSSDMYGMIEAFLQVTHLLEYLLAQNESLYFEEHTPKLLKIDAVRHLL